MITGAVPVAPYCDFKSALGSPFSGRLPAAIPPPATLFEGRRSGYFSPSTVDAMIQPFSPFVNPFLQKILPGAHACRIKDANSLAKALILRGFCRGSGRESFSGRKLAPRCGRGAVGARKKRLGRQGFAFSSGNAPFASALGDSGSSEPQ